MTDAFVDVMSRSHVWGRHSQRLCKNLPVTLGVVAAEVACVDQKSHLLAEKLQILKLARTVAVDAAAHAATAGTRGCMSSGAGRDYQSRIRLVHSLKYNLPTLAFRAN